MPKYKMMYGDAGEGGQVSFVCQRCCGTEDAETSFDTYNRPYHQHSREPGSCVVCSGTGFNPHPTADDLVCPECSGSGLCPDCHGQPNRDWNELPVEIQQGFMKKVEPVELFFHDYLTVSKFFRNY